MVPTPGLYYSSRIRQQFSCFIEIGCIIGGWQFVDASAVVLEALLTGGAFCW